MTATAQPATDAVSTEDAGRWARDDVRAALMQVHHLERPSEADTWIKAIEAEAVRRDREALRDVMEAVERVRREWCHISPDIEIRLAVALANMTAVIGDNRVAVDAALAQPDAQATK